MKSLKILNEMNNNKKEYILTKTDSIGNLITVINKINEPANKDELNILKKLSLIPDNYIDFLSFCNGARLFDYDGIDGLQLLGAKEIFKFTQYAKNTFEEDWDDRIIIFAKIIGEDNYLGFKITDNTKYEIIDCYFEECPREWQYIENSFDDFLSKYLQTKGNKFWI